MAVALTGSAYQSTYNGVNPLYPEFSVDGVYCASGTATQHVTQANYLVQGFGSEAVLDFSCTSSITPPVTAATPFANPQAIHVVVRRNAVPTPGL